MKQSTQINPTGGRDKDANRSESIVPQESDRSIKAVQPQQQQPTDQPRREQKPDRQTQPQQQPTDQPQREQKPDRQKQPHQQQQGMPTADELKGKWKQQVGAAKIMWGKLTEDELLKAEGHQQKLAGLVQERYAITRDEAEKQVKKFFEQNKY